MKLYLTDGAVWTGTQADAKAAGDKFAPVEVPTDKPNLLIFLQKLQNKITELRASRAGEGAALAVETPIVEAPPTPVQPPATPPSTPAGSLTDQILALDERELPKVLGVALGRLGEIAGPHGWAAFSKNIYAWTPAARSVEQGLGMLMLAALDQIGTRDRS